MLEPEPVIHSKKRSTRFVGQSSVNSDMWMSRETVEELRSSNESDLRQVGQGGAFAQSKEERWFRRVSKIQNKIIEEEEDA